MTRSGAKSWWGIDLPKGVISVSRDHPGADWIERTTAEVIKRKIEKQETLLSWKRAGATRKPCYVWVFYNKGFLFGGWHIYIKTAYEDYPLNFRTDRTELILKCMRLFPCGILPEVSFIKDWFQAFAREYNHIGFNRGLRGWKQGLAQCWCINDENARITDIYSKGL